MAGIDKTYTDCYKDYKEFKTWADNQKITFFNGLTKCIGDWVWKYEEKDFENGEIPIMNTPTWLDIYLINNCKIQFVLDRLKDVYNEESYEKFKTIDLTEKPSSDYQQNRKIIIKPDKGCNFRFKKRMFNKPIGAKTKWCLQSNDGFWYNKETKRWVDNAYYPTNTNTAHISSSKAIIRHLRKQYLPKGVTFSITGRYIGENYIAVVY